MLLVLLACCSYHLTTPTCYIPPDFTEMCVTALLRAYWFIVDFSSLPLQLVSFLALSKAGPSCDYGFTAGTYGACLRTMEVGSAVACRCSRCLRTLCDFGQWCGDGDVVMSTSDSTRIIMLLSSLCRVHYICLLLCVPSIFSFLYLPLSWQDAGFNVIIRM